MNLGYLSIKTDQTNNNSPVPGNKFVNKFTDRDSYWYTTTSVVYSYKAAETLLNLNYYHSQLDWFLLDQSTTIFSKAEKPILETYITIPEVQELIGANENFGSVLDDMGRI